MQLAQEVARIPWKSLSIVGTAKNAGKTTVLNYLYRHLYEEFPCLGVMSTGRDGEAVDLLTNEPKPRIALEEGTLVATARHSLAASRARVEVLETLPIRTVRGPLVLARVRQADEMELVGPATADQVRQAVEALRSAGACRVLVDGSMDRRRAAAPHITGHVVLASGASLAPQKQAVIERTALWVEFLKLKKVREPELHRRLTNENGQMIRLVDQDENLVELELASALGQEETIVRSLEPEYRGVVLPGAFTDELGRALLDLKRPLLVVVNDATCVFLSRKVYHRLSEAGVRLEVVHPIRLLAVCINPVGPQGVTFDANRFMEEMARALPRVGVFDIVSGLYREGERG